MTLIIFIIVLAIIVLVHEAGHFFAAKKAGVQVDEFGFGFPPRIWGKKYKGTLYSINWIPLGGFVKIKDETGDLAKADEHSFIKKSFSWKIFILSAGVLMNFLLAFVLFSFGYMIGVPKSLEKVSSDAYVEDRSVRIVSILDEAKKDYNGVETGDYLLSINNQTVENSQTIKDIVQTQTLGETVSVKILQGETEKEFNVPVITYNNSKIIGLALSDFGTVSYSPFLAIYHGAKDTVVIIAALFQGFYELIRDLVLGKGSAESLSGPVGLAVMTGKVAESGFSHLLIFVALLSLNLGVLNIIPFPALDGGRILFVIIEKLRRKSNNVSLENMFHLGGYVLLMGVVILVTYKDIVRYGSSIWESVVSLFS